MNLTSFWGNKSDLFTVFTDKQNRSQNLGTFVSSPKKVGENIQLTYSNGDSCGVNKRIKTVITLMCRPGENIHTLFSDPVKNWILICPGMTAKY